jgi:phosphatidylethanolamine-binding protein (PEBP) family uncharacterized protein
VATAVTAPKTTTPTTSSAPTTTSTAAKQPAGGAQPKSAKPAHKPSSTATSKAASTPAKAPSANPSNKTSTTAKSPPTFGKIALASSAFKAGGPLSSRYTCDGANLSPPLEWHGVPHGTAELFLLAIDLSGSANDAIQWAVAGIPPSAGGLSAGALPAGAVTGTNSAGKTDWGGVCGAKGQLHHVAFLFYALSHKLGLKAGFNPVLARSGLKGATLATGLTLATYQRP